MGTPSTLARVCRLGHRSTGVGARSYGEGMARKRRRITGQVVYDTAKAVAAGGHRLDLPAALLLCRIVLLHGGGPIDLKSPLGRELDKEIVRRMVRRGFLERGGQEVGQKARVASVLNLSTTPPGWTTNVQVGPGRLVAPLVTASEETISLVAKHLSW